MALYIKKKQAQRGLALIELTLVLLLLVLLTFGLMEYGWMFFKMQQVTDAARGGARHAVLPDSTNLEVQQTLASMMTAWGMGDSGYTMTISSADISLMESGEMVTVTVEVPYNNIELLGMALFPTPTNLRASVSMAKENP